MCNRLQRGEYGQQSELALIACKYNVEIIVFENGTQQWIQKPTGTRQQKHVIALRWCRDSIHYDWLKQINSDEPKRVTPLPVGVFKTWTKFHGRQQFTPPNIARVEQIQATKKQI